MSRASSIIVGGGIQSGVPFTLNALLFVQNTNPATGGTTSFASVVPTGATQGLILSQTGDPQPAATEILRMKGGIISEALGTGNADTFTAGRGVATLPNNSTGAVVIAPHLGAALPATALPGTIMIGDNITVTAGAANSIWMGKSLNVAAAGVIIAPSSTIGNPGGGSLTIIGTSITVTASQAANSTNVFGNGNTLDGAQGQGGHLVVGPSNTIHATATLGGNVILIGNNNFASDGTNTSIMLGISNGFVTSGKGTFNILIGRNLAANGAAGPFNGNLLIGWGTKLDTLPAASGVIAFADSQSGVGYSIIVFGNGGASGTSFTNAAPNPLLFRLTDASGANIAGSNLTFRASLGTGTGVAGQIIFQTGIRQAAGSTQHVATNRMLIQGDGTNPVVAINAPDSNTAIPVVVINGGANNHGINFAGFTNQAAAQVGTLNNAPAAGNPAFWMPIEIAGVLRSFPCW